MPDDRGHNIINTSAVIVGAPYALYFFGWDGLAGTAAFLFASLAFNPDLDLDSDPYAHWGPLKWYWWAYKKFVPHRDIISHGPVIGTVFRLLYLSPLIAVVLSAFVLTGKLTVDEIRTWATAHKITLAFVGGGLEVNSLLHIIADKVSTWFKRTF